MRSDYAAARTFIDALELLNDYLEVEPDSLHKEFIDRLKVSNLRSMLRNLSKVNVSDGLAWAGHVAILMNVDAEAEKLLGQFPELQKDYDDFMRVGAADDRGNKGSR